MEEKTYKIVKIQIKTGQAKPSTLGSILGQHGINIIKFCKDFNEKTKSLESLKITVSIKIFSDKKFSFVLKKAPTSILIKKTLGLSLDSKPSSGSSNPGKKTVGTITKIQLKKIAVYKNSDLNSFNIDAAIKIIAGTAISMGINVEK